MNPLTIILNFSTYALTPNTMQQIHDLLRMKDPGTFADPSLTYLQVIDVTIPSFSYDPPNFDLTDPLKNQARRIIRQIDWNAPVIATCDWIFWIPNDDANLSLSISDLLQPRHGYMRIHPSGRIVMRRIGRRLPIGEGGIVLRAMEIL
jgi:hypothetical protein